MAENQNSLIRRVLRWFGGTLLTAVVGGICWEWLVQPGLKLSGSRLQEFLSYISKTYADDLHARIAIDTTMAGIEDLAAMGNAFIIFGPGMLLIGIVALMRTRIVQRYKKGDFEEDRRIMVARSLLQRILDFMVPYEYGIVLAGYGFLAVWASLAAYNKSRDNYTRSAAVFIERSIAILGPVTLPIEKLQLEADYRAINSASDFYKLQDRLIEKSKESGIKIPEFVSVGRK